MKKAISASLLLLFLASCGKPDPQKFFSIAVLNVNLLAGFAGDGFSRQLESPSEKLGNDGSVSPVTRAETVETKLKAVEESYDNVKGLGGSEDEKEIIEASKKIYEYVIPVYRNEYMQLARLYDSNAPADQITALTDSIESKYNAGFRQLYDNLISLGKAYAARHGIKVNWGHN